MTREELHGKTLETIAQFLREIIGEDWALDIDIEAKTSFSRDLELESIEFVALAEKMQNHYGSRVDFVNWLSSKNINEVISLTVGELVEFIVQCHLCAQTA